MKIKIIELNLPYGIRFYPDTYHTFTNEDISRVGGWEEVSDEELRNLELGLDAVNKNIDRAGINKKAYCIIRCVEPAEYRELTSSILFDIATKTEQENAKREAKIRKANKTREANRIKKELKMLEELRNKYETV